jgi:hypothetical protein
MSHQAEPADPQSAVDETYKFWREIARETVKNSATSVEETAKQLITVIGILEGLYFHAITFGDLKGKITELLPLLTYLSPLIFWLFALIAASLVLFPRAYTLNINSSEAAKKLHEEAIPRKYLFLVLSLVWMVIGMLFLIIALWVYLTR